MTLSFATDTTPRTAPVTGLRCRNCGAGYDLAPVATCAACLGPLEIAYDESRFAHGIELRQIIEAGPRSIWRYAPLLPVAPYPRAMEGVGLTPLQRADNLAAILGLRHLYIKNDALNPTHSFKDRVVAMAVAQAISFGFDTIACASTGNLAGAVAAAGARAGLKTYVFVPQSIEPEKIRAAAVYGAHIVAVDGTYDQVNRLCAEVADEYDWGFVNLNLRAYYSEGSKTLGYEVAEQLNWTLPDHIVTPIASGSLYTRQYRAFTELIARGLVSDSHFPRISGAQAAGCNPVATAYSTHTLVIPVRTPQTIAHSLAIGNPADGETAVSVAQKTGGVIAEVTDDEIRDAISLLARTEGIFTEPAGGVTLAVARKLAAQGIIYPDEVTVVYITGNGLKTPAVLDNYVATPSNIAPTLDAFEQTVIGA